MALSENAFEKGMTWRKVESIRLELWDQPSYDFQSQNDPQSSNFHFSFSKGVITLAEVCVCVYACVCVCVCGIVTLHFSLSRKRQLFM